MNDRDTRPHRGSVLGCTLFRLGLNPSNEGAELLDMRPSAISRVLTGANPTPVELMRKIAWIVDDQRAMPTMIGGAKADSNMRIAHAVLDGRLGRDASTLSYWATKPIERNFDFEVEHSDRMRLDGASFSPAGSNITSLHIPDAVSPIAAAARLAVLSVNDMAFVSNSTVSRVRDMFLGNIRPEQQDWDAVFGVYDSHINQETPVGVAIGWMSMPTSRRSIEIAFGHGWPYSIKFFDLGDE